jgi:hypothetical protein
MTTISNQQQYKPLTVADDFQSIAATRRGQLALSALLSVITAALGLAPYVAIYLITAHLFANGTDGADTSYVLLIAGGSLLATLGKSLTMGASLHISHIAAYDILYETRSLRHPL